MNSRWMTWLAAMAFLGGEVGAKEFELRVTAGDHDYKEAVIMARAPEGFPQAGRLRQANNSPEIPFQRGLNHDVVFVLPALQKGQSLVYSVVDASPEKAITAELKDGTMTVASGGKKMFVYQGEASELPRPDIKPIYQRGGYIHPVLTPGGKMITDDYPRNHLHHHGIWAPWTKTEFQGRHPDFWNMGQGSGTVEFAGFGEHWSGPVSAGFVTHHRFVDLLPEKPVTALNETWEVSAYRVPDADYFVFDLKIEQNCATDSPLKLPKYYYGGLGVRGNWSWNGAANCLFMTVSGETNRVEGNETRAPWCYIGGDVEGAFAGMAILCDPQNFRAPQPMRLHPTEPFFCYAPSQEGDWAIEPGHSYTARYRFIVKDGKPDKTLLDRLWADFAHPPDVEFVIKP